MMVLRGPWRIGSEPWRVSLTLSGRPPRLPHPRRDAPGGSEVHQDRGRETSVEPAARTASIAGERPAARRGLTRRPSLAAFNDRTTEPPSLSQHSHGHEHRRPSGRSPLDHESHPPRRRLRPGSRPASEKAPRAFSPSRSRCACESYKPGYSVAPFEDDHPRRMPASGEVPACLARTVSKISRARTGNAEPWNSLSDR